MVSRNSTIEWPDVIPVSASERNILIPPPKPPMLQWARDNFVLPEKISKINGPWSDDYTPFIRRILTLLERPPVSVRISACTQSLKTTVVQILLSYICLIDPGPTGLVMPQEAGAKDRVRTKLRPIFEGMPKLFDKIGRDVRNLNIGEPTDLGDMILFLIWATSAAKLADATIQNMIYDEVGKFDILGGTGEHPIDLGRNRQRTYESIMRELIVSSPQDEGDLFDKEVRKGTDEQWYTPCMLCGKWHQLKTWVDPAGNAYFVLDKDKDGNYYHHDRYKSGKFSRYVCPRCGKAWSEANRWRSNQQGVWVPSGQVMDENGTVTGPTPDISVYSFNVHAMMLYTEFASYGSLAAKFVEAQEELAKGDKSKLKGWQRNQRNIPWKEMVKVVDSHKLEEKKNDYPAGVVPNDVKILVAGADFHKSEVGQVRVDYLVKGFADDLRNYDILFGHAASLEEMFRATTTQSFPWADKTDKKELMISCGFVDSGYQPDDPDNQIIDEVYQFCRRYWRLKIWYPIRGGKPNQVEMFKISPLDRVVEAAAKKYRRKTARQYRGMELITLAVVQFKDLVAAWGEAPMDAPASTSYNRDMPPEFFNELTNEFKGKNDKGQWGWWPREQGLPTHGLDVSGYASAAGYFRRVNELWSEQELEKIETAIKERNIQTHRPIRRVGRMTRFSNR